MKINKKKIYPYLSVLAFLMLLFSGYAMGINSQEGIPNFKHGGNTNLIMYCGLFLYVLQYYMGAKALGLKFFKQARKSLKKRTSTSKRPTPIGMDSFEMPMGNHPMSGNF